MPWPDAAGRLDASHRAIRLLLAEVKATGNMAAIGYALEQDEEASVEVLAATGRLDGALDRLARSVDPED